MIIFQHQRGAEKYTANIIEKLKCPKFLEDAKAIGDFDISYTSPWGVTGHTILAPLLEAKTEKIRIGFYTQNWFTYRLYQVNGYVDSTGRNMFLNTRQLWRPLRDIEETIWHEMVHISDSLNINAIYWHGDNDLSGKDETAPVRFAKWAANWNG
jgi:hypothetical protein